MIEFSDVGARLGLKPVTAVNYFLFLLYLFLFSPILTWTPHYVALNRPQTDRECSGHNLTEVCLRFRV